MVKWSNPSIIPILGVGAEEGTRTPTGVTPLDPESQTALFPHKHLLPYHTNFQACPSNRGKINW